MRRAIWCAWRIYESFCKIKDYDVLDMNQWVVDLVDISVFSREEERYA
jgi:hypothetical protein